MKLDIPRRALEALCYSALILSGAALLARALIGPFGAGFLSVHSPVNAQCIFGVALVLLMTVRAGAGSGFPVPQNTGRYDRWMPLLAALAAAVALTPSLGLYLFSDSFCFVADSAHYFSGFPMTTGHYFFRPIFYLVGGLVAWMAGNNLVLWHATGLLLHAAATVVFFFLARRVTGSAPAGLASAFLFAFHGSRPEAVAWIAGWPDPLAAGFVIAGLLLYLRDTDEPSLPGPPRLADLVRRGRMQ